MGRDKTWPNTETGKVAGPALHGGGPVGIHTDADNVAAGGVGLRIRGEGGDVDGPVQRRGSGIARVLHYKNAPL